MPRAARTPPQSVRSVWTLDNDDIRRRLALRSDHSALRLRRTDERPLFPRLCRTFSRADLAQGRRRHNGQSAIAQSRRRQGSNRKPARACAICRPTAPTSIRSNKRLQNLKRCCERPPRERPMRSSKPSPTRSQSSNHKNAQTTSQIQDIAALRENALTF